MLISIFISVTKLKIHFVLFNLFLLLGRDPLHGNILMNPNQNVMSATSILFVNFCNKKNPGESQTQ